MGPSDIRHTAPLRGLASSRLGIRFGLVGLVCLATLVVLSVVAGPAPAQTITGACPSRNLLPGAHLARANLRGANLSGAHLRGADLRGANLRGAHLRGRTCAGRTSPFTSPSIGPGCRRPGSVSASLTSFR